MSYAMTGLSGLYDRDPCHPCYWFDKNAEKYNRWPYLHEATVMSPCGENELVLWANWWFEKFWQHNLAGHNTGYNAHLCVDKCGKYQDPCPYGVPRGAYWVPVRPGVVNQMPKETARRAILTLLRTLIQKEKQKEFPAYPGDLMGKLISHGAQLLSNWDDSYACAEEFEATTAQYKDLTAWPTAELPSGGAQAASSATGYCKPMLAFSLDSKGIPYPGCKVHPECKRDFYGNIIPAPAPPPMMMGLLLSLAKQSEAQQQADLQKTTPFLFSTKQEPSEKDDEEPKKSSAAIAAASLLAVGAVGLVAYVALKGRT